MKSFFWGCKLFLFLLSSTFFLRTCVEFSILVVKMANNKQQILEHLQQQKRQLMMKQPPPSSKTTDTSHVISPFGSGNSPGQAYVSVGLFSKNGSESWKILAFFNIFTFFISTVIAILRGPGGQIFFMVFRRKQQIWWKSQKVKVLALSLRQIQLLEIFSFRRFPD